MLGRIFVTCLIFQSTLSVRRATIRLITPEAAHDISIHALREESDRDASQPRSQTRISIHALREESDTRTRHRQGIPCYFNPRSP